MQSKHASAHLTKAAMHIKDFMTIGSKCNVYTVQDEMNYTEEGNIMHTFLPPCGYLKTESSGTTYQISTDS